MLFTWITASALASVVYPAEVADKAGMSCTPSCTICHETNGGGSGTVVHEFGMAMMDRGLTGGSAIDRLDTAFDQLAADGVDSDGDGVADTEELAAGDNPNDATSICGGDAALTPTYGCFNTAASPMSVVGVLGGLLAVSVTRRRR